MDQLLFLAPRWLCGFIFLPLLYLFLARSEAIRGSRLAEFGISFKPRKQFIWGVLITLAFIFIALSRPSLGYQEFEIEGQGRDIAVILDVSRSMLARDATPSRLEAAKRKIYDLLSYLRAHSPGDRVALMLFSGASYLFCPFTSDYAVAKMFTKEASPELISAQGSALEDALKTAAKSFNEIQATSRHVVLLSDGEDLALSVRSAAAFLAQEKIILSAIGFGSPEGAPIPVKGGRFIENDSGETVITRLVEDNLRVLAEESGGVYFKARIDDSDLSVALGDRAEGTLRTGQKQHYRTYNEFGIWFLLLPLAHVLIRLWQKKPELLFIFLLMFSVNKVAHAQSRSAYEASRLYQKGDYEGAAKMFSSDIAKGKGSPKILHGLGSSYYRSGKYDEAAKIFSKMAEESESARDRFNGFYDLGNAKLAAGKFDEAIEAYDRALALNPDEEKSTFNRELAKRKREEQQKQQQKQDQDKEKDKNKEDKDQKDQPQDQDKKEEDKKDPEKDDPDKNKQDKDQEDRKEEEKQQDQNKNDERDKEEQKQDQEKGDDKTKDEEQNAGQQQEQEKDRETQGDTKNPETEKPEATASADPAKGQEGLATEEKTEQEQQAQAWLESVPDAPLLLRRKAGNLQGNKGQQW